MFNLTNFVKTNLISMIGKVPEYTIKQYAASWYNKSVLTENDILNINNEINLYNEKINKRG